MRWTTLHFVKELKLPEAVRRLHNLGARAPFDTAVHPNLQYDEAIHPHLPYLGKGEAAKKTYSNYQQQGRSESVLFLNPLLTADMDFRGYRLHRVV